MNALSRDKRRNLTAHTYDEMGRLRVTTYPDGTTEESTYDKEGRRKTFKDRDDRTTSYTYDPLGRLDTTTYPDTTSVKNTYDDAGRLTEVRDARGKTTFYGYDRAGRRTSVKVPISPGIFAETVFTYDPNGNQETVKDANGFTITYEYDEHNRRTKTIFPDTSFTTTTYDELGRRRTETDQGGRAVEFGYDCLGRLKKVIQTLGGRRLETTYGYDEVGNRISQTDANTHTTRFEYEKLGRETKRILPDGKSESKTYDAGGNLETRTDFLSRQTVYTYDENNRLTLREYPGSPQPPVGFTYTGTGRRKTATDVRYTYDLRDRLESLTYPDARKLEYGWDGNGNRTSLRATLGATVLDTTYTYDDANRLDLVTDLLNRTYDHGYDPNGNRSSLVHKRSDGTVVTTTEYVYDTLNRLTSLTTTGPLGTVQSYVYTLGPTGNRTKIDEAGGIVRDYTYDDLYRLTGDKVTVASVPDYEKVFTYDDVGNRLRQVTTGTGAPGTPTAPGTIDYVYDNRDRLLTEGTQVYTWDDNGSLGTKAAEATYTWDLENRLIKVQKADGTLVEHAYDADGIRIQSKTTLPGQSTETTNFLVDTSGSLSHVVAETDGAGSLKAHYVRGDDLLAVMRPDAASPSGWQTRFYHADGLGSVRRLTDEAGTITDGYTYTAFGELSSHTGTDAQPYAFTGEPLDPNVGFQYHRARWMDPRVGRFSATDSYPSSVEEPLTLHRYIYAGADSVNKRDPSGFFFSLSVSLTTIGIANTINAISVPIAEAIISTTASLELMPIWVRDRRWDGKTQLLGPFPGWPVQDMQAQLGQARSVWSRAQVMIHTAPERGPVLVEDSNIPRDQPASGQRIEEFIRAAGIQSVRPNQVPVVFIRTIGGTARKGRAFLGSLRESASIAMPFGVASDLSLAHEVGHVLLGPDHHFFPSNLMFPLALGGSDLTEAQAAVAREAVRIRSGGR